MSDFSFGLIAICKHNNLYEFLLIQHKNKSKHRAFPKGHKEKGESDLDAAKREFEEEVGIDSTLLNINPDRSKHTHYNFFAHWLNKKISKKVRYFLGYLDQKYPIIVQGEEILNYAWLSYKKALDKLTYETDKVLLKSLFKFLKLESR